MPSSPVFDSRTLARRAVTPNPFPSYGSVANRFGPAYGNDGFDTIEQLVANNPECSPDIVDPLDPQALREAYHAIYNLTRQVSASDVVHEVMQFVNLHLQDSFARDELDRERAGFLPSRHSLHIYRAFAEVSCSIDNAGIGIALRHFFTTYVETIATYDPAASLVLWCLATYKSNMPLAHKTHCLQLLLQRLPDLPEEIVGLGQRARAMSITLQHIRARSEPWYQPRPPLRRGGSSPTRQFLSQPPRSMDLAPFNRSIDPAFEYDDRREADTYVQLERVIEAQERATREKRKMLEMARGSGSRRNSVWGNILPAYNGFAGRFQSSGNFYDRREV